MAHPVFRAPRAHTHYQEPSPRWAHYTVPIGGKLYTWGGRTRDFSEHSKRQLQSVVETFDPYLEIWEQRPTRGIPPPGIYLGACTASGGSMFVCCGYDGNNQHSALHELDSTTLLWRELQVSNPSEGPMRKTACQMVSFEGDKLALFAGYGKPIGPTQPGSRFTKPRVTDERGWSNEFHLFHLKEGIWSSPSTTGDRPPPCAFFTFTAIDSHRAVLFGGAQPGHGRVDDAYILDLRAMHWKKLSKSGEWPVGRSTHAACCINFGEPHPQLLVTGGLDKDDKILSDAWLLDVDSGIWKELYLPRGVQPRRYHTVTAVSLGPGLTDATVFGGFSNRIPGATDDEQSKYCIAEATVLQFESIEIPSHVGGPPSKEWILVGVADKSQLGSQDRIREKMDKVQERAPLTEKEISWKERVQEAERELKEADKMAKEAKEEVEAMKQTLHEAEIQAAKVPTLEQTLQIKNDEIRRQMEQIDTQVHQLESQAAQVRQLKQQLDTTEKRLQSEMRKQQHQMEMKELEVIHLQYNLKGKEDQVKKQQEEIMEQQEEKREIMVQFQAEKKALTFQIKSLEDTLQARKREVKDVALQTSELPHSDSFQHLDTTQLQVAEVQQTAQLIQHNHKELIEKEEEISQLRSQQAHDVSAKDEPSSESLAIEAPASDVGEMLSLKEQQIREQHKHMQQQMEHITEVWKQVDQLQEVLMQRDAEIHDMHIQAQTKTTESTDASKGYLRGTEVVAQRSFPLTLQAHSFEWREYGFMLHVPEGSLPPEMTQTTVDVRVSLSGQFEFPEDSDLVSATYWLSCPHKFMKPLDVEFQHCAAITDPSHCSQLSFVITKCTQKELPYKFKELEGGTFSQYSSYGRISLTHFSGLAIASRKRPRLQPDTYPATDDQLEQTVHDGKRGPGVQYCAQLFTNKRVNDWKIQLMVTKNLKACCSVTEREYSAVVAEAIDISRFILEFAEEAISPDIPRSGTVLPNGWEIILPYDPAIERHEVDRYSPKRSLRVPGCEFVLRWSLEGKPPVYLKHPIALNGAKGDKYFTLYIPDPGTSAVDSSTSELSSPSGSVSSPSPLIDLVVNDRPKVMAYLTRIGNNQDLLMVGEYLGLDGNELRKNVNTDTFIFDLTSDWLSRKHRVDDVGTPTWSGLVQALEHVKQSGLANDIKKDLKLCS